MLRDDKVSLMTDTIVSKILEFTEKIFFTETNGDILKVYNKAR